MEEHELEQLILDYIRTIYSAEYTGYLKVIKSDGVYTLRLGIPSYMAWTQIAGEFTNDDDFLNYIYKELRERNYMKVYFYKVNRTDATTQER